jgi:AraC-like DNA-binding protein
VDPLTSILRSVRVATTILSRARLRAPWSLHTTGTPGPAFHAVVSGRLWVRRDGDARGAELGPGEVVVLPHGDGHTLGDGPGTAPTPRAGLRERTDAGRVPLLVHGGRGAEVRIVCGMFRFDRDASGVLRSLLPRVLFARDGAEVLPVVELLDRELEQARPGADAMVAHLTEALLVQALRHAAADTGPGGWLVALQDETIGRALALIHGEPAADWTADRLAARAGMSRSRFFERFTRLVGESPARYLARWRVTAAADLLRHGRLSVAELATRVGYGSEDAFTRVFKRYVGMSPRQYRRKLVA